MRKGKASGIRVSHVGVKSNSEGDAGGLTERSDEAKLSLSTQEIEDKKIGKFTPAALIATIQKEGTTMKRGRALVKNNEKRSES